jgi:hypothetical protein
MFSRSAQSGRISEGRRFDERNPKEERKMDGASPRSSSEEIRNEGFSDSFLHALGIRGESRFFEQSGFPRSRRFQGGHISYIFLPDRVAGIWIHCPSSRTGPGRPVFGLRIPRGYLRLLFAHEGLGFKLTTRNQSHTPFRRPALNPFCLSCRTPPSP